MQFSYSLRFPRICQFFAVLRAWNEGKRRITLFYIERRLNLGGISSSCDSPWLRGAIALQLPTGSGRDEGPFSSGWIRKWGSSRSIRVSIGFGRVWRRCQGWGGRFRQSRVSGISELLFIASKIIKIVLDHLAGKSSFRPSLFFDLKPLRRENRRFSESENFSQKTLAFGFLYGSFRSLLFFSTQSISWS